MLQGTQSTTTDYLIKQLPNATAFVNLGFEVVHVSDAWISDFKFGKRDVIGKTIYELFGNRGESWIKAMKSCMAGKGNQAGKERFTPGDSKERWFRWVVIPWYDDEENIAGTILQTEDITDRVRDELAYEKLEIQLREKSEIAKIGNWEYDAVSEILNWSETLREIHEAKPDFSCDIEEAINFYKEGYSRNTISMAVFNAMEHGASWSEKLQLVTAKGNEIWVISAGRPLFEDGKFTGIIGTLQDITDHVKSEIKTRESENLLRTVVDNLPLNVYIKDLDSRKILVNKSECEFLGVDNPEALLGKNDFELFDKEIAQQSREEDLMVLNTLTPLLGKETVTIRADGTVSTFLTSKIPLLGNDGRAYGLLGISMDISNLKKQEGELRDLINVTSLQNKKLINFAHIVSHNLRSHTANFSMLLDFLQFEEDEEERSSILNMLTTASDNLLETLENLNEVVAISMHVNLEIKPVRLNEKIAAVSRSLAAFLKNGNARIINEVPEDTYVKVVPAYIESILINFITNAVKYRDPKREPEIRISARQEGSYTVVAIKDNGLGIDLKKYGDKLFGMYKTFHENTEARGIGLYITKNQVEAMNGKITVSSQVGKGTTFNIYFDEKN